MFKNSKNDMNICKVIIKIKKTKKKQKVEMNNQNIRCIQTTLHHIEDNFIIFN